MNKIKMWIVQFLVKKYALGYLVEAYRFVKGYKTQICAAIAGIAWGLDVFNVITPEQAESIYQFVGGAASISFLAKLNTYKATAESVANMVIKEDGVRGVQDKPLDEPPPGMV